MKLNAGQIQNAMKLKGGPLTQEEIFLPERGRRDRAPMSQAGAYDRENFKGKRIARIKSDTEEALERERQLAQEALDKEAWKTMTPAERRLNFAEQGLAKLRAADAQTAAMKAHLKVHKEKLTELRELFERAKWLPNVTEDDIWTIEKAIQQIELGPDACPVEIDSVYVAAMSLPQRLADEANTVAQQQIVALQKEIATRNELLRVLDPNAAAPPVVTEEPPVVEVEVSAARKYFEESKALRAAGKIAESNEALVKSIMEYNAAHPGARIEEQLGYV